MWVELWCVYVDVVVIMDLVGVIECVDQCQLCVQCVGGFEFEVV